MGAHSRTIITIVDAGGECGSGITVFVLYGTRFTRIKAMVHPSSFQSLEFVTVLLPVFPTVAIPVSWYSWGYLTILGGIGSESNQLLTRSKSVARHNFCLPLTESDRRHSGTRKP